MFAEQRRSSLARMKDLVITPKPVIDVTLTDEQKDEFVPQYSSLDEIKGEVSITAPCDTSFDDIYISFDGSTRTFVEKVASTSPTNSKTEAFHTFVRLFQAVDLSPFSNPRVIEAGRIYTFPFHFVVPDTLLPQACTHPKKPGFPEGGHMTPPPSLGDPLVASSGKSLMDDMAPDMGTIAYSIRCRMTNGRGESGKYKVLAEGSKKLRVIPAVQEQPPLDVILEGDDRYDYKMRREQTIRKGMFKSKLGRIVVQSRQPQSLKLPYPRGPNADCNPTTVATVNVRFDPVGESSIAPGLNSLNAKLKVATCFTSRPMDEIPTKSGDYHYSNLRGIYVETLNLSSLCLSNMEWQKHAPSASLPDPQHPGIPNPSEAYNGGSFYTATIIVPISLPKGNKVLVPSFHTCLVSRIYALDLYLSISTPNTTITAPTVHLKLPLQVSSEGNPHKMHPAPEYTERAGPAAPPLQRAAHPTDHLYGPGHLRPRFQSLSFEREEEAPAPPPEYGQIGGASRHRVVSNVPSPPSSPRSI